MGTIKNLPLANVLYAYDQSDDTSILLEHNNTIYLGEDMEDSLANPVQSEEVGIRVDFLKELKHFTHMKKKHSHSYS